MLNKEIIEKMSSGNFIPVRAGKFNWEITSEIDNDTIFIHVKHSHILDAFLNGECVRQGSRGEGAGIFMALDSHSFIESYDEDNDYVIANVAYELYKKEIKDREQEKKRTHVIAGEEKIGLKKIGKHIDTITDDITPERMRLISSWLKNKAKYINSAADLQESFEKDNK